MEIRSPGDETYEKLPFYARLRVREVVVIDRTSKRPEARRLDGGRYVQAPVNTDGWVDSEVLAIRLRGDGGRLHLMHRPSGTTTAI